MVEHNKHWLAAFRARDSRWNGRFLAANLKTKTYCLPSCSRRRTSAQQTQFFGDSTAARVGGLRPCKQCKPDQFEQSNTSQRDCVLRLWEAVRSDPSSFQSESDLASFAGLGADDLSAQAQRQLHLTPAELHDLARCQFASEKISKSRLAWSELSQAAGFATGAELKTACLRHNAMTPQELRDLGNTRDFRLRLPRGFRPQDGLLQLGRDAASISERADTKNAELSLSLDNRAARLLVRFGPAHALCSVASPRKPSKAAMRAAHSVALRIFGLRGDPQAFEQQSPNKSMVTRLVGARSGLRIPLTPNLFQCMTWAVVGQQVNLPFAFALRRRLIDLAGTDAGNGLKLHPSPTQVAQLEPEDLTPHQFSRRKAEYLIDLSRSICESKLQLDGHFEIGVPALEASLLSQRGLGPWSVNYILMKGLGLGDCVPWGDSGLNASLEQFFSLDGRPDRLQVATLMENFRPFRSLASFHFWKRL